MDAGISAISEMVGDVFQKWCTSRSRCDKDKGTDTSETASYVEWLNDCHQGSELPARLNWIVQRCRRNPLRETMSATFGTFIRTASTAISFENASDAHFWKNHAESLLIVDTLMEYVWEHFNSGHWKDTPPYWRRVYSWLSACKVAMLSIAPGVSLAEIVKVCDVALLVGTSQSQLTNIFSEIATRLNRLLSISSFESHLGLGQQNTPCNEALERRKYAFFSIQRLGQELEMPSENLPSLEHFTSAYFQQKLPVLIKGAMKAWPALGKWSPQHIARVAGSRTVPVEIGSAYTAKDWTQKLMTIQEFVNTYMPMSMSGSQATEIGYLAQHQLLDQVPELKQDIEVPEYCLVGEKDDVEINTWFGPAGTVTPTHFDAKHNVLTQVFGAKLIILFPPSEKRFLYPHSEGSLLFNTSQVNIEDLAEYEAFPDALKASYYVVFLQAGDMLYMPPKYWHFVRSLSPSFSLSFWFE